MYIHTCVSRDATHECVITHVNKYTCILLYICMYMYVSVLYVYCGVFVVF